jgi:hypothetical protein
MTMTNWRRKNTVFFEKVIKTHLGNRVKIGIVDSGTSKKFRNIKKCVNIVVKSANSPPKTSENCKDENGHGTICSTIINKIAPEAELYIVKILDNQMKANSLELIQAIRWLICQKVDIINLSVMSLDFEYFIRLYNIIALCESKNIKVVASSLSGNLSFPGDFPFLISASNEFPREAKGSIVPKGKCIIIRGYQNFLKPAFKIPSCSSFSAPFITGLAARLLSWDSSLTTYEIKTILRSLGVSRQENTEIAWERFSMLIGNKIK